MGKKHDCTCGKDHHARDSGSGFGFALGVAIGAAAAAMTAPEAGKQTRDKAQAKLDELTGGKTPEQLLDSVKEVAQQVVTDIRGAASEGKKEAAKERERVLKNPTGRRTRG